MSKTLSIESNDFRIIHVDMDAFFASVEQRDNPDLKGKPIAVGSPPDKRGVVAAASYEARKYGVRSAMNSSQAVRLCPQLIFTPPRFDAYKEASNTIRAVFLEYTQLVEPLSLDEAYLDVTAQSFNFHVAVEIAKEIREKIFQKTGLTASAGVSVNKFLAKTASDLNKPDGLSIITQDEAADFVAKLKIEKFYGIGSATAEKMHKLGISNGADLRKWSPQALELQFGKSAQYYFNISRGLDFRKVNPNRESKSVGAENTLNQNTRNPEEVLAEIRSLIEVIQNRLKKNNLKGRTVSLKLKYEDFSLITRSKTISSNIQSAKEILDVVNILFEPELFENPIRLVGVSISNFSILEGSQLNFEL
ncbi:MAG: DNA polymerase-4 [Sphingobacteriales bacterium]|jgi:DNA polymerase-4